MPVKQAIQSQLLPPASLPCIITFLGRCVSRLVHHLVAGAKIRLNADKVRIFSTSLSAAVKLSSSFLRTAGKQPRFPGKRVCTRSNGPINCLDYSMCRYLTAVLVAARRWFTRGECAREEKWGGGRRGKETGTGLTWTDGRSMECDRPSCTHTHTAWLSNCWKLQLIKCGYECVKSNLDMCMPLPPAAEMIFGLMVLNTDLLDGFSAARIISPKGGRLEAAWTRQLFRKNSVQLFACQAIWAALSLRKQASQLAVQRQAKTLIFARKPKQSSI